MGYITPDTLPPVSYVYRRLRIPDDRQFDANVTGALLELCATYNWESLGGISTDVAAVLAWDMVQDYMSGGVWMATGNLFPFASDTVPTHCLECDGSVYNRVDYPSLYAVLDTAFIIDADTFRVPDMRGNVPIGSDAGSGSSYPVGSIGGEVGHVLTSSELASHNHIDAGHSHLEQGTVPFPFTIGAGAPAIAAVGVPAVTSPGSANILATGGDQAHNNLQPYVALRYAIVAE